MIPGLEIIEIKKNKALSWITIIKFKLYDVYTMLCVCLYVNATGKRSIRANPIFHWNSKTNSNNIGFGTNGSLEKNGYKTKINIPCNKLLYNLH